MRNVGIKELKDQASAIVNAGEVVTIERYGRPVGMYVPLSVEAGDKAKAYEYAANLERLLGEVAGQNGLTDDELADEVEAWAESGKAS